MMKELEMNDSRTATLNTAALAALGALMASGLWLEPDSAKALVTLGMCALALVAGWRMRDRLNRVPAWAFFAVAMALAIAPLAAGELHGASRWLFPGEALQLRGGLWAALFYAAGLARIDGSGSVIAQRLTLGVAFVALLAIIVVFGGQPDLFSAFMLFVGVLVVVWQRPHVARKVVTWPIVVCVVVLAGLILKSPFRLERVVSGLQRAWLAPGTDPMGRGWAATQTQAAMMENSEWFGAGIRSELPARIEWYGITELATQAGLAAAIAATLALAFFSAVLVKRAISLRTGPAGGFWLAGVTLFAVNALVSVGPAFGVVPYMGHWSVPFVSAADINWMGAFFAGALLLPAVRTGAPAPATQATASAGA